MRESLVDQLLAFEKPQRLAFVSRHNQRLRGPYRSSRFALEQRQRMRFALVVGRDEFHRFQQLPRLGRGVVRGDAAALVAEDRLSHLARRPLLVTAVPPCAASRARAKALGRRFTEALLILIGQPDPIKIALRGASPRQMRRRRRRRKHVGFVDHGSAGIRRDILLVAKSLGP